MVTMESRWYSVHRSSMPCTPALPPKHHRPRRPLASWRGGHGVQAEVSGGRQGGARGGALQGQEGQVGALGI